MTDSLIGEIDIFPWLDILVTTELGQKSIKFLVDTGFEGELAIPREYISFFGKPRHSLELRFADGLETQTPIVKCQVNWLNEEKTVTAYYIDGDNPLLGMELLEGCLVTIDLTSASREITVEMPD